MKYLHIFLASLLQFFWDFKWNIDEVSIEAKMFATFLILIFILLTMLFFISKI